MAKINDTSVFPITAPALNDLLLGTDKSNTSNDANGETVNFTAQSIGLLVPSTVLLATLSPTSGTSISTSTLDLTGYRKLFVAFDDVAISSGGGVETFSIAATVIWSSNIAAPVTLNGAVQLELTGGVGFSVVQHTGAAAQATGLNTTITTVTTTIAFALSGGATYTGGTIRVFGER